MPENRLQRFRMHCRILTPLHIGSGEEVLPLELLRSDKDFLFRIRPERLVEHFSPEQSKDWFRHAGKADFWEMKKMLFKHFKPGSPAEAYQLHAEKDVLDHFREHIERGKGLYEILAIERAADGRILIPGSSIKGALRTAVLNERLRVDKPGPTEYRPPENFRIDRANQRESDAMQQAILGHEKRGKAGPMELDPFRAVRVRDALLPANAARLVFANNRSLKREDKSDDGIPLQLEATDAAVYGEPAACAFETEIQLDLALQETMQQEYGIAPVDKKDLVHGCYYFFEKVYQEEIERFHQPWGMRGKMDALLESTRETNPKTGGKTAREVLLRLGRFSHVEAMTVEACRRVQNPPSSRERFSERPGSARTLIDGKIPFGWLAFRLEDIH